MTRTDQLEMPSATSRGDRGGQLTTDRVNEKTRQRCDTLRAWSTSSELMNDIKVSRDPALSKTSGHARLKRHKEKLRALGLTNSPVLERERASKRIRTRRRAKKKIAERIKFVDDFKTSHGCADCGYSGHPAALDFDHLPGFEKTINISILRRRWSTRLSTLEAEMAKCEVVCANCHRIRTANRKQWLKSEKIMQAQHVRRAEPPPNISSDRNNKAWRESVGWYRAASDYRCSKCGDSGHSIQRCPKGADTLRGILSRALTCPKNLDEIVEATGLERVTANVALCAMRRRGIARKNGQNWELTGKTYDRRPGRPSRGRMTLESLPA